MDGDEAFRCRHLREITDAAEMAGLAQGDRGEPVLLGLFDADAHRLRPDRLAESVMAVEDGDGGRVDHGGDALAGLDPALLQPVHIARHAGDAVAVMAGEVRLGEVVADAPRLVGIAARLLENGGDERLQPISIDQSHGDPPLSLRRSWRASRPAPSARGGVALRPPRFPSAKRRV